MKVLKWIFIVFLIFIVAFFIVNATQDSLLKIEESIVIDAPAEKVFNEITDFESWDEWSAWNKMDPDMEQSYKGTPREVGYVNSWKSNNQNVGNGRQEIVEIERPTYMKTKMNFEDFEADNYSSFRLAETEGGTRVTWDYEGGEMPFFMRFLNLMIEPAIRENYRKSLRDLKEVVENKPDEVPNPENLEMVEVDARNIISIRDTTTPGEIGNTLRDLYTELSIFMATQEGLEMEGMPLAIYYFYSEEMVDLEAAFPVKGDAQGSDRIKVGQTPSGKVIKAIHKGDYNASDKIHMAIEEYVDKRKDIDFVGMCWEVYANDPEEVDSAEVITEIFYPIK